MEKLSEDDVPFLQKRVGENVPLTRWEQLCCFFWTAENEPYNIRFRYISFKIYPVFIELVLYCILYYTWAFKFWRNFDGFQGSNAFFALFSILWITSLFFFLYAHCKDPGYLPFHYSTFENRKKFTLDDIKEGTATTPEQIEWARTQPKPERACFSGTAGRYILRGDHYCSYFGNWIGLYNERFFLFAILYMGICSFYYFLCCLQLLIMKKRPFSVFLIVLFMIISLFYSVILLLNLYNQINLVSRNITLLEFLKKSDVNYNKGCIKNFEEVCGPIKYIMLWPLPIPLPLSTDGFSFHNKVPENIDQSNCV